MLIVPEELWPELVRARWEDRFTYTQLAARYPLYSRTALVRAVRRASHRTYYQPACAWCERRFRTTRADARFCSRSCANALRDFHYRLESVRCPPSQLAGRQCASCQQPFRAIRADHRYCSKRCRDAARYQAKRKGR